MKSLLILSSLLVLVVPVIPLCINDSKQSNQVISDSASPVQVNLYYETLCPYCKTFVINQLAPVDAKLKKTGIMSLSMFPYGNARYVVHNSTQDVTFTCQHGVEECKGNMILVRKWINNWIRLTKIFENNV